MACVQNSDANTNGPCPQWSYSASTNQLSSSTGCTYDAAGNLTKDCSTAAGHTYQWDAEGRVAVVDPGPSPTWSFTYNAVGDRVQWAYSGGADQHLFDPAGTWLGNAGEYSAVWRGNVALAVYIWGDTLFNHANQLGSTTLRTNQAGTAVEDILFYPWGQNTWKLSGSGGYNFAGMPYYDTTTNTDLTQFRLYSPGLGRWHSPDPMAGDLTNPQSLNRYAYVLNNPTTLTDPQGLQGCPPGTTQGPGPQQCSANALAMTQVQMGWGVMFTWDLLQLMEIPVYTWVPPGEVQVTINGTSYPAQWQPGYWAPTGTVADASAGLLESLGEIGSSPSWWGTFVGSFVKDFSLKGARRPGESYGACVERVENSLFGGVGAQVFGAVTGTSLVTGAFTGSFGTQTLPGVIDIATRAPLAVPNPSLAAMAAESAAQLGTISAEAAGTVSTVAAVLGKVFVPVAAVTGGIAGGILASCR